MTNRSIAAKLVAAGFVVAAAAAAAISGATSAAAAPKYGCEWPKVCFYLYEKDWNEKDPTAAYQDMGYWQELGPRSRGSEHVYNSRRDDGAVLKMEDGTKYCLQPGKWARFMPWYGRGSVTSLKIVNSPSCTGEGVAGSVSG